MKDHLAGYKDRLVKSICEYMDMPVSERSAGAIHEMFKTLEDIEGHMEKNRTFTHNDALIWADKLVNDDGTTGAHWTIEQTTGVAQNMGVMFDHITDWCWWITMNMIYSDYCKVAINYGVNLPQFYGDMSKAFLFDKDAPAPEEKLGAYYHAIVCKGDAY